MEMDGTCSQSPLRWPTAYRLRISASDLVLVSSKPWIPRIFASDLVLVSPEVQKVTFWNILVVKPQNNFQKSEK